MTDHLLDQFVRLAVGTRAQVGLENFAGDPIVLRFFDSLVDHCDLDVTMYVSWECPPEAMVVEGPRGVALVRSERLDTLLVEYHHVIGLLPIFGGELADDVPRSVALRWMAEMLIGYRQPSLAITALGARPPTPGLELHNPFRDQTLASVPVWERTAIQCFSIAHELGHVATPLRTEGDLSTEVDLIPILSHIDYEDRAAGRPESEVERTRDVARAVLDPLQLLREIDADLFAVDAVVQFLHHGLGCDLDVAVRCTIEAFEAQLFVYNCKALSHLLADLATGRVDDHERMVGEVAADWQSVARARAVVRRAGILWALLERDDPGLVPPFGDYVERVDDLIRPRAPARAHLREVQGHCMDLLLEETATAASGEPAWLDLLDADPSLHREVFWILVAFGCPGSVDVRRYLSSMDPPAGGGDRARRR